MSGLDAATSTVLSVAGHIDTAAIGENDHGDLIADQ